MTLSELIISYRAEHSLSQRQLASRCSLSTGYISLIEKEINPQTGKRMVPTLTVLNKLAKGMGMTIDDLFATCDDMPVDISAKENEPTTLSGNGLDSEIIQLLASLSDSKKAEALSFLRYLAKTAEN